jgi:hypothetical protein
VTNLAGYAETREDAIRQTIEEQHLLGELMKHAGWQVFTRYCAEWLESHEQLLRSGAISSLEEYKLTAGRADGIRQVFRIPELVAQRLEKLQDPAGGGYVDELEIARLEADQRSQYHRENPE